MDVDRGGARRAIGLRSARLFVQWRWAFAAVGVLALFGVAYWSIAHQLRTRRDLVRVDGSPVEAGDWIETDSQSRATLKVGEHRVRWKSSRARDCAW